MRIERRYTEAEKSPYAGIEFRTTTSEIRNPDGSIVFQLKDIEVPADWSQVACDVLAQKYFRKAGIPTKRYAVAEADVPVWLRRHAADEAALAALEPAQRTAGELHRVIGAVFFAHTNRSDQVGDIVAAHGLDVHINSPL